MISHQQFGELRLKGFLPDHDLAELTNWEFMENLWVGEALEFSEWLRLETEPEILRSLAIDFEAFPKDSAVAVLNTIGLPLRHGMTFEQIVALLGKPYKSQSFLSDRDTYEFKIGTGSQYYVSCTVLSDRGLIYLLVMTPLNSDVRSH